VLGAFALDVTVGVDDARWDGVGEVLAGELLRGQGQPDGLAGVLDRGQPEHRAREGERPDVPDVGGVDLLAVQAVLHPAVGEHGHPELVRVGEVDLGR
jgi:hypothetical protein